jgi:hypothetical protein
VIDTRTAWSIRVEVSQIQLLGILSLRLLISSKSNDSLFPIPELTNKMFKFSPRLSGRNSCNRSIEQLFLIALSISIVTLSFQLPSWGKAGFAEWQDSTPGENMIGNIEQSNGIFLGDERRTYLDHTVDYGFYDGAVIGISKQAGTERYFLFNEDTKKIEFFTTKSNLCNVVNNKFKPVPLINALNYRYFIFCLWYSLCFMICFKTSLWLSQRNPNLAASNFDLKQIIEHTNFTKYLILSLPSIVMVPAIFIRDLMTAWCMFVLCFLPWLIIFAIFTRIAMRILLSKDGFILQPQRSNRSRSIYQSTVFISVFIFGLCGIILLIALWPSSSFRC